VSVMLASDRVALYPPGDLDAHGWREPPDDTRPAWSGMGSLQLTAGLSDPRAAGGGGRGPHDPAAAGAGLLYLPPAAEPREGWTAVVRGEPYVLSQVRFVADPTGPGLACWAATVTGRRDDG
jgi:hypothetical protein